MMVLMFFLSFAILLVGLFALINSAQSTDPDKQNILDEFVSGNIHEANHTNNPFLLVVVPFALLWAKIKDEVDVNSVYFDQIKILRGQLFLFFGFLGIEYYFGEGRNSLSDGHIIYTFAFIHGAFFILSIYINRKGISIENIRNILSNMTSLEKINKNKQKAFMVINYSVATFLLILNILFDYTF